MSIVNLYYNKSTAILTSKKIIIQDGSKKTVFPFARKKTSLEGKGYDRKKKEKNLLLAESKEEKKFESQRPNGYSELREIDLANEIDPEPSRRSFDRSVDRSWHQRLEAAAAAFLENARFENTRATAAYINLSLSLPLFSFRSARRPLALENGQYPCKLNCADVSVKLKRMENRFSACVHARARLFCARASAKILLSIRSRRERRGGEEEKESFSQA